MRYELIFESCNEVAYIIIESGIERKSECTQHASEDIEEKLSRLVDGEYGMTTVLVVHHDTKEDIVAITGYLSFVGAIF